MATDWTKSSTNATNWSNVSSNATAFLNRETVNLGVIMDDPVYLMDDTVATMDDSKLLNYVAPATSWT